jgi:putative zinc finger protein
VLDASGHDCARARARVSVRLDGELSELEEVQLVAHLGRCASCGSSAVELAGIARLLRAAPYERPETEIVVPGRRRSAVTLMHFAAAAAAFFAGVGLLSTHLPVQGDEPSPAHRLSPSSSSARGSERPTYLDSMDYEQDLIAAARAVYQSSRSSDVAHE